ncbi:type II toxin-antitoxin system prevent-host-death family antitoxin [Arsenicitalea aurantiaca]|uniref:Antitoxin n=1 Tax=Arsenicitalea aurantiaca TaxID=1783274 RepID=A0A433X8F8_9HYPH|nr:type II toxin-antitoxin system prevent-host-death family antitoxin [Arsenicitalea aurantiaca]RUT30371.1 type II toxin-antitoxin system prevent-host-death family antitoxin [Arsenicitalea aurantiaca]
MIDFTATDAKNKFGLLIDTARTEPVRIHKNGRDVAIVLSPVEYARLLENAGPRVNPLVERLHAESVQRRRIVYETLAQ